MPSDQITRRRTRRVWDAAAPWLVTAAAIGLAVAVIGVLGGWRKAPADLGPDLGEERQVELLRWTVEIGEVTLTDTAPEGYDTDDTLQIALTLTNVSDETLDEPDQGVLEIIVPPGSGAEPELGFSSSLPRGYDPDIPREAVLQLSYPEGTTAPEVSEVTLVIRDEKESGGFITQGSYSTTEPVGHVVLPCTDKRRR